MNANLVYITAAGAEEANQIGRALISDRLAACVNIFSNMRCMYWWDGDVQNDEEVVLIAKTKASLVPELIEKVRALHSYDVPCIIALPIETGHQPFLDWIGEETR
jgi:periplasmic divalent cation tolerance protein